LRARRRLERLQAHARRVADRTQAERERHESVDAVFEMVDRDRELGGGIMAAALVYRLFVWSLPFALVAVGGLGVASSVADESPEKAARSIGVAGLVTSSVANAANSPAHWYVFLVGLPVLVWATRSLLRTLIVIHRLVWTDLRASAPKPTLSSTLLLLAVLAGLFSVSALGSAARAWSVSGGAVVTIAVAFVDLGLWLLVSMRLPHRNAQLPFLLPGAILFAIGLVVINVVTAYLIAPQASSKQSTYGALGLAAALLLGLYFVTRLVVATAVVNATLWERHVRHAGAQRRR
jgi:uncharacterized BrkB/YihY/UPF0761 family membrane protein